MDVGLRGGSDSHWEERSTWAGGKPPRKVILYIREITVRAWQMEEFLASAYIAMGANR